MENKKMIKKIKLQKFKKLNDCEIDLDKITVLVGANNSGKSCFLQGVHFGITLTQTQKIARAQQFPAEKLRYCPTDDFLNLKHLDRLTETSGITFSYERQSDDVVDNTTLTLLRGRNGVVRVDTTPSPFLDIIADPKGFFSIYVPGLAGITIREEFRSDLVVNNGIARGDANLYLRNVLHRINQSVVKKNRFDTLLEKIFPGYKETTTFSITDDLWIKSAIELPDGSNRPLDTAGTGLLQTIQLLAYVTNYEPKLLLLDEPDSHLHPNNQRLLAETLHLISQTTDTQIVLATHSRHLLDALSDYSDTKLYWMREGSSQKQDEWGDISVLMDLGALDRGEQFLNGAYRFLFWTEDSNTRLIEILLEANGFPMNETLIFSYQASSKIDAAFLVKNFVGRIRPGVKVITHRDRDFMTDDECARLLAKYDLIDQTTEVFITRYSDIEAYFVHSSHIAQAYAINENDARTLVEGAIQNHSNEIILKFRDKRDNIKKDLYKTDPQNCPDTHSFIPGNVIPWEYSLGKLTLKKLNETLQANQRDPKQLIMASPALQDPYLRNMLGNTA